MLDGTAQSLLNNDEVKELNSKEPEGFTLQKLNPFK